ncbi:hypothetical protein [Listeria rocourtiae]|uniref:hypothetical protein n=1 Tax=Listeria rocourtiae TaxID=647910 RepID=UPI0004B15AA0|nr:hypothetical protein [Listeria rocourtiae]
MLIKKLKERYPDLTYSEKPLKINTTHLFFYENPYYFAIPKKTLTSEEQALLQSLFQAPAPVFKNEQLTEWHTLLFTQEDVIIHPENNSFRIIQFQIQSTSLSKKNTTRMAKGTGQLFRTRYRAYYAHRRLWHLD